METKGMYRVNHSWLYGAVKPYFEIQGIKLIKDDMRFIEECLGNVPPEFHRKLMRDYFTIWNTKVALKESGALNAINPRAEANIYLRGVSGSKDNAPP
jgi:hypothetical protein